MAIDLPLIWALILAVGVMMYVLLDGFDLGVGMFTAVAESEEERNMMTATVEPVWDGNETWLDHWRWRSLRGLPDCVCHHHACLLFAGVDHACGLDLPRSRL